MFHALLQNVQTEFGGLWVEARVVFFGQFRSWTERRVTEGLPRLAPFNAPHTSGWILTEPIIFLSESAPYSYREYFGLLFYF